ncbi:DUF4142 domain-containing protein [Acidipila sp. EB88]|nr:DUF4142 domain-containing protein [Acidipila sp. EB88]
MFGKRFAGGTVALLLASAAALHAAAPASDTDKTFVGKVSQGGMYEVAASKVAVQKAQAQDVKDLANTEVHDHTLVGDKLKRISAEGGIPVAATLNTEFQQRLDKLKSVPAAQFDGAYLSDMSSIHEKDQKLFAQEAIDGSGAFKVFAGETDKIVKRHIGAINAK